MTWKWVLRQEGRYEVSDAGEIRSWITPGRPNATRLTEPRTLNQWVDRTGRHYVCLRYLDESRRRRPFVHHLVLEAFSGPRPSGLECAHLNGNTHDNRAENLMWTTHRENIGHQDLHGTRARGEASSRSSLSNAEAAEIVASTESGLVLAARFCVSKSTISRVRRGERYAHVGGDLAHTVAL